MEKHIFFNDEVDQTKILTNINHVENRIFILPPSILNNQDIECQIKYFYPEKTITQLGFLGNAWKMVHRKTKKIYCVKGLDKFKIVDNYKTAKTAKFNKYLSLMYELRHESIVRLLSHFETSKSICLIYQYVFDSSILEKITGGFLTKLQIMKYTKQIFNVVQYLHDKGIYDISLEPESILIDSNDNIRLTDCSFSSIVNWKNMNKTGGEKVEVYKEGSYGPKEFTNVNSYVPPEIISKKGNNKIKITRANSSPESDIWQIGILIYELVTGSQPFTENITLSLIHYDVTKINFNKIPNEFKFFKELLPKMLCANPKERIDIKTILSLKEYSDENVKYTLTPIEEGEEIINRKKVTNFKNEQEQMIAELFDKNKELETEISQLKRDKEDLIKEINELREYVKKFEDVTTINPTNETLNEFQELKKKAMSLENENEIIKIQLKDEKLNNESMSTLLKSLNKEMEEMTQNYEANSFKLESKIESLEKRLFNQKNPKNVRENLEMYLMFFNDSVKDFKTFVETITEQSNVGNEAYLEKLKSILDKKENEYKEVVNSIKETYEKCHLFKLSDDNFKGNKEQSDWVNERLSELIQFKNKCSTLEGIKNKLEKENTVLNEECKLAKMESESLKVLQKQMNKKFQIFEQKINIANDFVSKNCADVFDRFKSACNIE